jgi:hypothetical protein
LGRLGWAASSVFFTVHLPPTGKATPVRYFANSNQTSINTSVTCTYQNHRRWLDVITDGEQTRFDFNLSFYGYIKGIQNNNAELRKFGPPAHNQRGKKTIAPMLPDFLDVTVDELHTAA